MFSLQSKESHPSDLFNFLWANTHILLSLTLKLVARKIYFRRDPSVLVSQINSLDVKMRYIQNFYFNQNSISK